MTVVELLAHTRLRLAGAPREALGIDAQQRRILGIARAPRIVADGSVWHLGALLVGDEEVYATGEVIRSAPEVRRGYAAESQRQRAARAAAAFRGGFPEGTTVHVGWRLLDPAALDRGEASPPLAVVDAVPSIRWSAAGAYMPLERYLDERIALLLDPAPGA